jgi:hypothetical protein
LAADYTVYMKQETASWKVFACTYLGLNFPRTSPFFLLFFLSKRLRAFDFSPCMATNASPLPQSSSSSASELSWWPPSFYRRVNLRKWRISTARRKGEKKGKSALFRLLVVLLSNVLVPNLGVPLNELRHQLLAFRVVQVHNFDTCFQTE